MSHIEWICVPITSSAQEEEERLLMKNTTNCYLEPESHKHPDNSLCYHPETNDLFYGVYLPEEEEDEISIPSFKLFNKVKLLISLGLPKNEIEALLND